MIGSEINDNRTIINNADSIGLTVANQTENDSHAFSARVDDAFESGLKKTFNVLENKLDRIEKPSNSSIAETIRSNNIASNQL